MYARMYVDMWAHSLYVFHCTFYVGKYIIGNECPVSFKIN